MSDFYIAPLCPKCTGERTIRVKRKGLLQLVFWNKFGFFPWECMGCRTVFVTKNRGKLQRRRRFVAEVSLPPMV